MTSGITSRMTSRIDSFLIIFSLLYILGSSVAIYDPSATTVKPAKRKDLPRPWYLTGEDYPGTSEDLELLRSSNWQISPDEARPKKPIANLDTVTWTPWRKNTGSEIEQRTEIVGDQQTETNFDQTRDFILTYDQYEQRESNKLHEKLNPGAHVHGTQDRNRLNTQNPLNNANPPNGDKQMETENDRELYEGISIDNTKPHKEKILVSSKPQPTVAQYDPQLGAQCPTTESTGQFVYPPDCKFFVNCWKGRAFVQPCAPGTLFNPNTLECDFPYKVECYGGNFPSSDNSNSFERLKFLPDSSASFDTNRPQIPKCPPHVTGLLPHPLECTKFLQCANGQTFIMNCGPGTVFNPTISVCDWPRNVRGCEDVFKSKEDESPLIPPNTSHYEKLDYKEQQSVKKITCPPDYTGLLPHPENCKKFLQCANGVTYVMDCGPGTAFNPLTSVCDWPHNVPGCSNDKRISTQLPSNVVTTAKPWSSRNPKDSRPLEHPYRYNHSWIGDREQGSWTLGQTNHLTTTNQPEVDWNSRLRPTWRPNWKPNSWTTIRPMYDSKFQGQYDHTGSNTDYPYESDRQWNIPGEATEHHKATGREHDSYPGHWQSGGGTNNKNHIQNNEENIRNQHHHYHTHHPHHPNPHRFQTHYIEQGTVNENLHPTQSESFGHSTGYNHHRPPNNPRESPNFSETGAPVKFDEPTVGFHEGGVQPNEKIDPNLTPNRREYGRTNPGYPHSLYDQTSAPDGNIYVNSDYEFSIPGRPNPTKAPSIWRWESRNKITNTQSGHIGANLNKWNQDTTDRDIKYRDQRYQINVYPQSTVDKESEAKLNQWSKKTNLFLYSKDYTQPGQNSTKSSYPNGIYVNINGTRGHFIVKEIGAAPENSKTVKGRPNDLQGSRNIHKTYNGSTLNISHLYGQPSSNLQPPYYNPVTHSFGYSTNTTGSDSRYSSTTGHRSPKYYLGNSTSTTSNPIDLIGSYSVNDHRAIPFPSTVLQPPHYQPSNNLSTFPRVLYVPAVNLQPPYYQPSTHPAEPLNVSAPATHLQPPFYDFSDSLGSQNFTQPQNSGRQYPAVSLPESQPPYYEPTDRSTTPSSTTEVHLIAGSNNSFGSTRSTTRRPPDKHMELPVKKNVFQNTQKVANDVVTTTDPNIPSVSIEYDDNSNLSESKVDVLEPDVDYDVDILDKEVWKPVLVFENKTKTSTESSVIMKINKKKVDVDLFNIEAAPFSEDEAPFPVYYVPPVEPLSHSKNSARLTPTSGQVIRLRGGSGPTDGYVEVQGINPGWGIICDSRNSWTLKEAHVVCKQLGYTRGAEMAWQGRTNRNGMPTWIAANSVTCHGNETRFQSCKFTHEHECRVERDAIGVRCTPNRVAHCRKDEIPYEGQCYHLADPDSGLNHAEALDYCVQRQARLIDITTQLENDFVSEWLLQLHPEVGSIMTSGVGFTTFNRTLWLWEDSSRAKFRFTKWWPGWLEDKKHPPWVGSRPACVIMKRKFPCHERPDTICVADYFFWDTEDCASSTKGHAYICKRPYDDIGCIYGKGNLYAGNANVTASGKACLSWGDEEVAHPLLVNVVNRDVRDKLKTHNYCRNPNPNKESRPWCFTGPYGEREYCDIPPCGNIGSKKSLLTGQCKPKHFECMPGECIPSPWVCDGEEDCTNGADERTCTTHLNLFQKMARQRLEGYDVEKWLNTPLKTCALRCKEADFTCRSFTHKADGNVCLLSDSNIGMTGALKPSKEYDYYEMKERSINCDGMYVCGNRKCINQTQVCNGKNDCNDRTDESICTIENLDYAIRLAGSDNNYEGRIEVKILGVWGQVCDDGFGMIDADVICKELGFVLGALEVRPGGFYGNIDPPTRFMVDQLQCRGNETSLRECDFDGWGVHNCQPEEAVGVVCKTAVDTCQEGHWKCDNSPVCIPTPFICDEVSDCPDGSDESVEHCEAQFEIRLVNGSSQFQGRVEVRHHGIWGTVCDDDFSNSTAAVICRSLGYGGIAIAKKDGFFGAGTGPIWLDEVFCHGNESQLNRCEHNHWGQHNCDHNEDAGVICTPGDVNNSELFWETVAEVPEVDVNDLLPADCGKRSKDFNDDEDFIFAKVVHGSVAPKGTYPWQASIRVRGHSRSSHWCGAVVISPLHVLTAAHCLEGYNKGTYFVRAGDYNTEIDEGTEAEANIEDYYIHEDFRKGHRMNNDIALVLLKGRGIPLGKDIMPICLPAENTEYSAGLNCTISGFGSIETGKSTHSKDLRYGWIPLLDQSVCRAGYIYGEGAISDGMVCAGYLDEGVDTCDGDSGGPLACFHNGVFSLYGITSWGQHCGKANKPGVYVRVSHYRRWIDQKIKESLAGR